MSERKQGSRKQTAEGLERIRVKKKRNRTRMRRIRKKVNGANIRKRKWSSCGKEKVKSEDPVEGKGIRDGGEKGVIM